jgi:hypothetical protein
MPGQNPVRHAFVIAGGNGECGIEEAKSDAFHMRGESDVLVPEEHEIRFCDAVWKPDRMDILHRAPVIQYWISVFLTGNEFMVSDLRYFHAKVPHCQLKPIQLLREFLQSHAAIGNYPSRHIVPTHSVSPFLIQI